jgi:tetratricopeptide (TPR) repeat protein
VLNNLGNVALDSGDLDTAAHRYRESLAAFETLGDAYHAALLRNNLALALRRTGDVDVGGIQALLDQSLAAFQGLGDPRGVARATGTKARVLDAAGDHRAALPLHVEALALRRDLGDLCGLINSLEGLSLSLATLGRPRLAAQLIGHASAMREREGEPRDSDDDVEVDAAVAAITTALGDKELEAELQRGRDASLDELLPDDLALPPER